jgi:hypothetical protein
LVMVDAYAKDKNKSLSETNQRGCIIGLKKIILFLQA